MLCWSCFYSLRKMAVLLLFYFRNAQGTMPFFLILPGLHLLFKGFHLAYNLLRDAAPAPDAVAKEVASEALSAASDEAKSELKNFGIDLLKAGDVLVANRTLCTQLLGAHARSFSH